MIRLLLVCPNCLEADKRDPRDYREPHACTVCGALLQLRFDGKPHLVLVCRNCGQDIEDVEGQPAPGMLPVCLHCGAEPCWPK